MRVRAVILAAALMLAPLGARAADLVVWWEEGFNPEEDQAVREIVAAFEQKTGKQVELVFSPQEELPAKILAALEAGHPPDFLYGMPISDYYGPWAHEGRLVDLADALGPLAAQFDQDALDARHAARRDDRPARPLRAADGPLRQPRPRLEEPARAGRLHARRHPEGVGAVLVLLVRQGPAGRAQGHRPRRHLRRRPADVGRRATRRSGSGSS